TRYLSRIQTTDNRTIYFNYGASPFFYSRPSQVVAIMSDRPNANCPASSVGTSYTYYTINNNTLGEISFDGGKVVFETSTEYRNDIHNIDPNSNVPYLKKVKIYNGSNALITEYTFNYTNGGRLVLNEVVKTDTSGTSARWQFEYIGGTSFPNLFLGGTDHWGYANGSSRGIPNANYATLAPGWAGNTNTVNKESDFANSSTSLLKKIVYPTGGSSSFEYESNAITYTSPDQLLGKSFLQRSYPYTYISIVNENTASQDEIYGSFTLTEPTKVSVSAYRWYQPISRIESVVRLSLTPTGTNILDYAPYGFQCGSYACTANAVVTLLQVLIIIR
ncbi:MAG: hypothetical protein J7578_23120, partial [Chitinophagaceae bacterium]|nr:hypothetical protein [Chitinophagaceae bacterium]